MEISLRIRTACTVQMNTQAAKGTAQESKVVILKPNLGFSFGFCNHAVINGKKSSSSRTHWYICIVFLVFSAMLAAQYGSNAPWWAELFEVLGIAHLFLLIFSAKSLVFFFGVCALLQFTLVLSKARAQKNQTSRYFLLRCSAYFYWHRFL